MLTSNLLLLFDEETPAPPMASLGSWSGKTEEQRKKEVIDDVVAEPIHPMVVARLRDEMLSASLAQDVIARAKAASRKRNNEVALLLMI